MRRAWRTWPRLAFLSAVLLASGCSRNDVPGEARIEPQYWGDIQVRLETRPEPLRPGMNEFLVIATRKRGLPAYNLVVSLRLGESSPWRQAIEDGESGVYRRALAVQPTDSVLDVRLRVSREQTSTILHFPLRLQ